MKKIFMVLIVLVSLFMIPNFKVNAIEDSFYEGEYISGEYIKKFKSGSSTGKYEQLKFFRRTRDNEPVYCIQLWETLSSNKLLTGYDDKQYTYAKMDYNIWERIMLISYYGYGYGNHTSNKWYAVTQYMIWKETSPDSNIYFTDTLNGNKITKYEDEMNEINALIRTHHTVPSFNNKTFELRYDEEYTITDTNNVLDSFEISSSSMKSTNINGNQLTVKKNVPGSSMVILKREDKKYKTNPIVYIDNNGQNLLAPGNYYVINVIVRFNLPSTNITVNKLDNDTKMNVGQGDAKLEGSKFQLLDQNNNVVKEETTNENSILTFEEVGYGNYSIKEVQQGVGYLLNNQVIPVEVNESTPTINFYNQVIKNDIVFKKYIRNSITGISIEEEGAHFSIYDTNGNLISNFETNALGIFQITLPYGKYIVKQNTGTKNHYYVDDFIINVEEDGKIQTINLYNEELTANIKIINTDSISNLPLLEGGAKFKIKNQETNEYIKNNEQDLILETSSLGDTGFYLLSSGKYMIEQIKSIDDYEINTDNFFFEIDDDVRLEIDENGNKYLQIFVPSDRKTSKIQVNKFTETYYDDELISREKDIDIIIPIYANQDIYTKDGIMLYYKDEQVSETILDNGNIISPDLYFGNYYIINPVGNEKIDTLLNSVDKKTIDIIVQIYEYSKNDKSKEDMEEINNPIVDDLEEIDEQDILPSNKPIDEIKVEIKNEPTIEITVSQDNKYEDKIENEFCDIEEEIIADINNEMTADIDNKSNEIINNLNNEFSEKVIVPNTYTKESLLSYLGYILIIISFIFIKREKYEDK